MGVIGQELAAERQELEGLKVEQMEEQLEEVRQ